MLEDFKIKVFVAVASIGSFTKAGELLGITQPAVSQNVAELEKLTGVKLFNRERGVITMTREGEVFSNYASRAVYLGKSIGALFVKLAPARVRIQVSEEIYQWYLSPLLSSFSIVHPQVIFERSLFDDCDLKLYMAPSSPLGLSPSSVAKFRVSFSTVPAETAGLTSSIEKTSYFEICYQPSDSFSHTKLCQMLKEYLIVSL